MATVTTINVPDNLIPPEAEPLTLSGVTAAGLEDIGHYTATTPVSDNHHGSDHGNDDRLSTNSSSPTDDWPQWASVSTEPEPSQQLQQLQQHQHERPPRVSTTAKMVFGAGGNNLSTTTLIPPSLFMEPTLSNIVVEENPPNLNHIFAVAYNNNNNNNGQNTMVTPNIEQSTATIDTTTIGNAKLAILQIPRNQIFKESLLMASQNVLPMYLPNPNHPLPLVPGQPNQMPGQKGNPQFGNMYADLADFAPFIPPYYFVDQGKPANVQHRPQSALKKFFKRPPLRSKIPNGSNTANGTNTSNTNKSLSSSSSSGLMAVGSSPNVAKIPTIASPYMFGNLGPTQLPQLMGAAYSPSTFGHAYYSPLLFLDNTFVGADASRFKPLIKKMKQKQKAKQNAFNVKAEAASTPNITMPANIYVPDDILEDYSQNDQQLTSNQTDNKNENSMMNEKVTNDLDESLHSEESNPMESLFGRQEPDSNNRKQLIKDRIDEEENRSGLSPQAQINANFFNGTAPRSTKPKTKLKPNSNRVKDILRTRSKVTKSISSEQFKANSNNPFNSESNRSNNTNAYQNNDDIDYVDEMEPASSSSSSISLDTFLRHLRANPDGDHSQ
ncbi:hypothetical protein RDWZM_003566 [Blomia tropicalis]|uniref:Uncharacterized protein n=1 Tax=Blomia tropicalis TaxID=40697 RepID=A0A9Q0RSP6_BLOTA|nr:hypothetical protein RDWZM_003566 [Blomia tropicalis]